MSTLLEQIENVKADNSKNLLEKYRFCRIELGLDHENVCNVLDIPYYGPSTRLHTQVDNELRQRRVSDTRETWLEGIKNATDPWFTFGVEIECLLRPNFNIIAALSAANIPYVNAVNNYNHHDSDSAYKVMTDASVGSEINNVPREVVSPVLHDFVTLEKVLQILNNADTKVNKTCGLHVHLGAANLSDAAQVNVFYNYQKLERLIDSMLAPSRRNNTYCKSLQYVNFEYVHSFASLQAAMHHDRYHKVNAQAYNRHQTIEFRQHQGSTNYTKIHNWVMFLQKLVRFSERERLTSEINDIMNVPFLSDSEKTYFAGRVAAFAANN